MLRQRPAISANGMLQLKRGEPLLTHNPTLRKAATQGILLRKTNLCLHIGTNLWYTETVL